MNQVLLTRLFKSIEGDKNTPLIKIAYSIIRAEEEKGHSKLANKLSAIIENNIIKSASSNRNKTFKIAKQADLKSLQTEDISYL